MGFLRTSERTALWLDGVYLRYSMPTKRGGIFGAALLVSDGGSKVWLTAVTMQGVGGQDRRCHTCGVESRGSVYIEGGQLSCI